MTPKSRSELKTPTIRDTVAPSPNDALDINSITNLLKEINEKQEFMMTAITQNKAMIG